MISALVAEKSIFLDIQQFDRQMNTCLEESDVFFIACRACVFSLLVVEVFASDDFTLKLNGIESLYWIS